MSSPEKARDTKARYEYVLNDDPFTACGHTKDAPLVERNNNNTYYTAYGRRLGDELMRVTRYGVRI